MKSLKHVFALLLIIAMLFSFAACSKSTDSGDNAQNAPQSANDQKGAAPVGAAEENSELLNGEKIRSAVQSIPATFAPYAPGDVGRNYVLPCVYQTLIARDKKTGELICLLAESVEKIDADVYHIKMRENIVDSLGNKVDAYDAKFSIDTCIADGNVFPIKKYVKNVEVLDEYNLNITLSVDDDTSISNLLMCYIISEESYNACGGDMSENPIGTGPYTLSDFVSDTSVTLTKVDNYWGADLAADESFSGANWFKQNFDTIEFTKISEHSQASIALETGLVDLVEITTSSEAERFMNNENYTVMAYPDVLTYNIFFSMDPSRIAANDENLRKAIFYAIDASAANTAVGGYSDLCVSCGCYWLADNLESWKTEDYFSYDLDKAKELLAESSYNGETLKMLFINLEERTKVAQVLQSYLAAAGINVELVGVDNSTYSSMRLQLTDYDIALDQSSGESMTSVFYNFLHSDVNWIGLNDPVLDELITACNTTEGHSEENIDACHQYIKEHALGYGLFCQFNFDVAVSDIVDVPKDTRFCALPGAAVLAK